MDGELYAAREELRVLGDRVARLMLSDPAAGAQLIPSLLQASDRVDTILHTMGSAFA